jgi:hypothetical protein
MPSTNRRNPRHRIIQQQSKNYDFSTGKSAFVGLLFLLHFSSPLFPSHLLTQAWQYQQLSKTRNKSYYQSSVLTGGTQDVGDHHQHSDCHQEDINAAWRFASLHGSSVGRHIVNGQSHHPFNRDRNESPITTTAVLPQQPQKEWNHASDWTPLTSHFSQKTIEDDDGTFSPPSIASSYSHQQKHQQYPMPKLHQGIYQLTNEEEYR